MSGDNGSDQDGATAVLDHPTTPEQLLTRAGELRGTLLEHGDKLRQLREKPEDQRSVTWTAELRATSAEITSLDAELTAFLSAHRAMTEGRAAQPGQGTGPTAALATPGGREQRTAGQIFVGSTNYRERRSSKHTEPVEVRTLLDTSVDDPAAGLFMPVGQPIPPRPRQQRLFVRDLLSSQGTQLNSVPYIRELSPAVNETGASATDEGSLKPEATMQFVAADAPTRKIPAWIPVTDEIIEDAPTLRGYIDNRLVYMLMVAEQDEILNGDGATPHLLGIRQTPGLQTQTAVTGDVPATIGLAIGKIETADLEADGLVMYPIDYWTAVTTRHADQLDNGFSVGAPGGTPMTTLWGLRVVRSRAMTQGKALVGSWAMSASIFDRRQASIRVTDSHADYFIHNKQVILAEERIALAVYRPDGFCEADIAFS